MPEVVPVLILMGLAFVFAVLVILVTFILGPKNPTPEKLAPYESGIQEVEAPRSRFRVKSSPPACCSSSSSPGRVDHPAGHPHAPA